MDSLLIECVWYESKREFNKFVRAIEDTNLTIVDYSIIKNKLIKADAKGDEPNDYIIGLNIVSSIRAVLTGKKISTTTLVYSFKNLDEDTVSNFKQLIDEESEREVTFVLNVLNMPDVPSKGVLNKFDCIKFVDND